MRDLEKELAKVKAEMERTRRMVRLGTEDEDTGNALILSYKKRIAEIQVKLHAAGSVMTPPDRARHRRRVSRTVGEGRRAT